MRILRYLTFAFLFHFSCNVFAQQNLVYNHYFLNPSLYNPSYYGSSGYSEVFLNYRKQWSGIEGAPTTATLNFHLPFSHKTAIGLSAYQDEAGVLVTTTGLIAFSYNIYLGSSESVNHRLSFGIAGGITHSYVKTEISDPAVANKNTSSVDGQFGLNYRFKNLNLSFAIPRLFETFVTSDVSFNEPGIRQIKTTLSSASYVFKFSERISFEPVVLYRTYETFDPQFEGMGILRFNNIGWVGGAYRQDYGASALIGFGINDKIKLGYAYEFATQQSDRISNGSHELQLVVRFGKKKNRPDKAPIISETNETEPEEEITPVVTAEPRVNEPVLESVPEKTAETTETKSPIVVAEEKPEPKATTISGVGLAPGHYIIVGAFQYPENAKKYMNSLIKAGYPAEVAYYPVRGYYLVHMKRAETLDEARVLRDKYRQMSRYSFKDTWVLTIE